jgi:hypothetical protein
MKRKGRQAVLLLGCVSHASLLQIDNWTWQSQIGAARQPAGRDLTCLIGGISPQSDLLLCDGLLDPDTIGLLCPSVLSY